ncbi:MAG: hypothetical protein MJZ28_00350 [Paludibacteraceae bacterium]|nr:hypothetical protein [Paludibacteraceae bacterium]
MEQSLVGPHPIGSPHHYGLPIPVMEIPISGIDYAVIVPNGLNQGRSET